MCAFNHDRLRVWKQRHWEHARVWGGGEAEPGEALERRPGGAWLEGRWKWGGERPQGEGGWWAAGAPHTLPPQGKRLTGPCEVSPRP